MIDFRRTADDNSHLLMFLAQNNEENRLDRLVPRQCFRPPHFGARPCIRPRSAKQSGTPTVVYLLRLEGTYIGLRISNELTTYLRPRYVFTEATGEWVQFKFSYLP